MACGVGAGAPSTTITRRGARHHAARRRISTARLRIWIRDGQPERYSHLFYVLAQLLFTNKRRRNITVKGGLDDCNFTVIFGLTGELATITSPN